MSANDVKPMSQTPPFNDFNAIVAPFLIVFWSPQMIGNASTALFRAASKPKIFGFALIA
jgi:hypothetical protein